MDKKLEKEIFDYIEYEISYIMKKNSLSRYCAIIHLIDSQEKFLSFNKSFLKILKSLISGEKEDGK